MRKLPSRGWGPWRQEFYSFRSDTREIEDFNFGLWHNCWLHHVSSFMYGHWPNLWRWWFNLPPMRWAWLRRVKTFFPNLR